MKTLLTSLSLVLVLGITGGVANAASSTDTELLADTQEQIEAGRLRFAANCGFCHGRDAGGGAQGLDLIRSELVADDVDGNLISPVIRNGRVDTNMPAFTSSTINNADLNAIVAFIHNQKLVSESVVGGRRSVEPEDLATGDAEQGLRYFQASCSRCHSASGDLAGIASRLQGLALLRRMLHPGRAASPALLTITTANGQSIRGALAYRDEFTVAMTDASGNYQSWSTKRVTFSIDNPVDAHVEQLAIYTDEDMHNVLAYLQSLR